MNEIQKMINEAEFSPEYWEEFARIDFACLLNDNLEEHGQTREELSVKSGISKIYLSEILGGDADDLKLSTMCRLMYELGDRLIFSCEPIKHEASVIDMTTRAISNVYIYEQPEYSNESESIEYAKATEYILGELVA